MLNMHTHLLESEEKLTGTRLTLVPRRRSAPTSESAVLLLLLLLLYAAPFPAICWLDPPLAVAWGSCMALGRPPAAVGSSRLEPWTVSGRAVLVFVRGHKLYRFCYNKKIPLWKRESKETGETFLILYVVFVLSNFRGGCLVWRHY